MQLKFENDIKELGDEMEKLAPTLRAMSKFDEVEKRFKASSLDFEETRQAAKEAKEAFQEIKRERLCCGLINSLDTSDF